MRYKQFFGVSAITFIVGYVGGRLYARYLDHQWQRELAEAYDRVQRQIVPDDEVLQYDDDDIVVHTPLCVSEDLCEAPENLEKYNRYGSHPQHGRRARKHRERALGLGIFDSPEIDIEPVERRVLRSDADWDRLEQEADEHEQCYNLQRSGAGASTCLVDGEQPQNCPHYHEWDLTMP